MVRRLTAAVATVLLLLVQPAEARPLTARDLAMIDRVSSPRISPDGKWVAYNLRSTDWEGNRGVNALHLLDRSNPDAKRPPIVTAERAPASPRWSRDGRWLYFLSGKSGTQQLWRVNPANGERHQLTAFPLDIAAYRISADGRRLIAAMDAYPDCPNLACSKARQEEKDKQKATGIHVASGTARFWDAYEDERFLGLFSVALDGAGAPTDAVPLTPGFRADVPSKPGGDETSFAVSPDGRTVYFASRDPAGEQGEQAGAILYAVPGDGSARPRVLAARPKGANFGPALSPDGRRLAYLSTEGSGWSYDRTMLMVMDVASGRTRPVAPRSDLALSRLSWTPDSQTILAIGQERGQGPLYAFEAATGRARTLVAEGTVSDMDAASGITAYVSESLTSPQQLFALAGTDPPRQLTRAAAPLLAEVELGPAEQFSFPGWNGGTVHGYVVKPHGYREGETYPVAFLIHGGPHSSFGNAWSYRWNPQVWSGMGYAVVMIDFHGSSGYGEAFGRSIIGHWGDRPLEDLQKGWAHALRTYPFLDGNRACALGGSYGGYMVAWIASQWQQPWKCLVNHAGLFDTRSMAWSADIPAFTEIQYGGWTRPEEVERFNPAAHIASWTVPMLVIHGARDYRVPLDQGIAAYNAARRAKVPSEFLVFPDENHWILKPQNSAQWYAHVERWMDRWTATPSTGAAR